MAGKKVFIGLLSLFLFLVFTHAGNLSKADNGNERIPDDAIRLRILANSNSAADQATKRAIRDAVKRDVDRWVRELTSAEAAKRVIRSHLDDVRRTVRETLSEKGVHESFTVTFGKAVFPTKMYGGYVYPAGRYDALVITLGAGKGANWWCVLFPPLCFLDFSNGDAVKPDVEKAEASGHGGQRPDAQHDVKVEFFLANIIHSVIGFFKGLFS
ncbi:stage II sporulation protein R [Caenibacillus caldisaponilyticus]|uniref:stage II sporulation protein R n=1 Tax=Caenibacillus caldisaponilyticus TaxID=1674942 RepID=UPI0009887BCD|nr:stage II sporulation protein R [Caenibacillus caldisaponilyticus]